MAKVRTVVVDDQLVARGYFESAIGASGRYEVVASFGDAGAAVDFCASRTGDGPGPGSGGAPAAVSAAAPVDLVVLDIVMRAGPDGLTAARAIKAANPAVKTVIVTSMPEASYLERARAIGVEGFWYKEFADRPLLEVLDAVMAGRVVYPDAAPPVALGAIESSDLTATELAVLREMTAGASNVQIAESMGVSVHTVRTHVKHLLAKTGFSTRTQLAVNAARSGLVVVEDGVGAAQPRPQAASQSGSGPQA